MERLRGFDTVYCSLESPTSLFQVGAVVVFDPATAPGGTPLHLALPQVLADRIHLMPAFRRRLVRVPFGLDHPRWVEDPDFDLDRHLHRAAIPGPGGPAQLADYAADVLGRPLEADQPPWELHLVEGLEDGLVAALVKIHHAAIDGISGVELTAALMDLTPEISTVAPPRQPWRPEEVPSGARLAADSVLALARRGPALAGAALRTAQALGRIRRHNREPDAVAPPAPFTAPRTSLDRRPGPGRRVAFTRVERADVDAVRAATGTTVNEVILALSAAAVRAQLLEEGTCPLRPLVALVPVSTREAGEAGMAGTNRLSAMLVSLATTLDDPLLRLLAIADGSRQARDQDRLLGSHTIEDLAAALTPGVLAATARLAHRTGLTNRFPPCNLVISSFPGPVQPLFCAGAEMVGYHPFGPVVDGAALNITAMSYRDHLGFGLIAGSDTVPELATLAGRIPEAMGELLKVTT